jgi:hypothetical protein
MIASASKILSNLKKKGYIKDEVREDGSGGLGITAKTERAIRQAALDQIFWKLETIRKW